VKRTEFFDYVNNWTESLCKGQRFCFSKMEKLWAEYRKGADIEEILSRSWGNIKDKINYPMYWISCGATWEDAQKYSASPYDWLPCMLCGVIFKKADGYKTCCCEDHYTQHRINGNKRLSESRLKYNPRDPEQYAARHGISVEQAADIIFGFVQSGNHRSIKYWTDRGVSEEDAVLIISDRQSKCSHRSPKYWTSRGYSEEEAIKRVSEYQSSTSKLNKLKHGCTRRFSPWCVEYYVERGYSEEEGKKIVRDNGVKWFDYYRSIAHPTACRENSQYCKEYYVKRYGDDWEEKYIEKMEYLAKCRSSFRSKIADGVFAKLNDRFTWLESNRYFGDNEFVIYSKEHGRSFSYDYVDTTLKVVVEFNGDYWHANPLLYNPDDKIKFPNNRVVLAEDVWMGDYKKNGVISSRGYRVIILWEHEYDTHGVDWCVDKLYKEIMNEDCKN